MADDACLGADLSALDNFMETSRPWQLEMTGDLNGLPTDQNTDAILIRLFDWMPELSSITIRTEGGGILARRVFPSDAGDAIDALLLGLFKLAPAATELALQTAWTTHVATSEAPYGSELRRDIASIRSALNGGTISDREA